MLAANINDLIEELKEIGIKIFHDTSTKFLEKLESDENLQHFVGLIRLQVTELKSSLKVSDNISGSMDSATTSDL